MKKIQITFKFDEDTVAALRLTAAKYGTSQALIAETAIKRECERIKNSKEPLFE